MDRKKLQWTTFSDFWLLLLLLFFLFGNFAFGACVRVCEAEYAFVCSSISPLWLFCFWNCRFDICTYRLYFSMWYIIFWSHFVCHTNGFSNFVFVSPHIESMCGMNCAIGACLNGKLYRIWIEDEENWNFVRANAFISLHTFDKVFDWTERPQMWITNLLNCTQAQQINAQLPYHFDLAYTWKQCKVNCNNSIAKCPDFSGSLTEKKE